MQKAVEPKEKIFDVVDLVIFERKNELILKNPDSSGGPNSKGTFS